MTDTRGHYDHLMNGNAVIKAVVFDLDGTLIHSAIDFAAMKEAIINILVANGVRSGALSASEFNYEIIRIGLKKLDDLGMTETQKRKLMSKISVAMDEIELRSVSEATGIHGAIEALTALRENGAKIGVSTRACRDYTKAVLRSCGLEGYVDTFVARDDVKEAKPHPEQLFAITRKLDVTLRNLLFVGDSVVDALCAKNAGVRFIGVLSGISNENQFRASECVCVLRTVAELLSRIMRLLPRHYGA
jgi:HAD superfamily hydrolase (TIGR01549 family)